MRAARAAHACADARSRPRRGRAVRRARPRAAQRAKTARVVVGKEAAGGAGGKARESFTRSTQVFGKLQEQQAAGAGARKPTAAERAARPAPGGSSLPRGSTAAYKL